MGREAGGGGDLVVPSFAGIRQSSPTVGGEEPTLCTTEISSVFAALGRSVRDCV